MSHALQFSVEFQESDREQWLQLARRAALLVLERGRLARSIAAETEMFNFAVERVREGATTPLDGRNGPWTHYEWLREESAARIAADRAKLDGIDTALAECASRSKEF